MMSLLPKCVRINIPQRNKNKIVLTSLDWNICIALRDGIFYDELVTLRAVVH